MLLSKEEMITLIDRIRNREFESEQELDDLEYRLESSVADPNLRQYMFASDPPMTAREIVEKVSQYRPIQL